MILDYCQCPKHIIPVVPQRRYRHTDKKDLNIYGVELYFVCGACGKEIKEVDDT